MHDFVLLHESAQWLNEAKDHIEAFLNMALNARINPKKTILQPIERGVDMVGQVIKPWRRITRRKTVRTAMQRTACCDTSDLLETANSYFGLFRQASASHHDRAELANLLRYRGHCIKADMTKTYRRKHQSCIYSDSPDAPARERTPSPTFSSKRTASSNSRLPTRSRTASRP